MTRTTSACALAVLAAGVVACAHAAPSDSAAQQRRSAADRYQAGEDFCWGGALEACLDLAEWDLRAARKPRPEDEDLPARTRLRRARGRFVRLCDELGSGEACLRIGQEYADLFEGRPGPRPRAAYARSACALGLAEGCALVEKIAPDE